MPYIDRNEAGHVTGIYACQQREGQEFAESAELYVPTPAPIQQIRAIEAELADDQARLNRQTSLTVAVREAMLLPAAAGLSREQVHEYLLLTNAKYKRVWDAEEAVKTLRDLI